MRCARAAALLVTILSVSCGGKSPPPNDETAAKKGDDTASASNAGGDSGAPAAAASAADAPGQAAPAGASASSSAAASPSSSGDLKANAGDDPWLASHQMPQKEVAGTMRGAQGKVQACFKAGLKRDPSTSGEVKIRFVVTNDGAVRVWKDDGSSMTDGDVTQCVGDLLNKLKFPKQKSPGDAWGIYAVRYGL
jgi:hypothetical protein